jgi:transcriptional regulator with XRE-family HTH domain
MELHKAEAPALGQVVGRNVQDLRNRAGLTQTEFTTRCQKLGLSWHRTKISVLESGGARNVTLSNLVLLALALEAHPSDLLQGDGEVWLNPHLRCDLSELQRFLEGGGAPQLVPANRPSAGGPAAMMDEDPPLEAELSRRFDVPVHEIRHSATNAFEGRTVTQERDAQMARLGPLTKEQRTTHRGHVMRRISAAIEADLRRRNQVY